MLLFLVYLHRHMTRKLYIFIVSTVLRCAFPLLKHDPNYISWHIWYIRAFRYLFADRHASPPIANIICSVWPSWYTTTTRLLPNNPQIINFGLLLYKKIKKHGLIYLQDSRIKSIFTSNTSYIFTEYDFIYSL